MLGYMLGHMLAPAAVLLLLPAVVAVAGGIAPAGATADGDQGEGDGGPAQAFGEVRNLACGWWWQEAPTHTTSVSVCATDGVGNAHPGAEAFVYVARYTCFHGGDSCQGASFEGAVPRDAVGFDPLLRRAFVRTNLDGCAVDVEFVGTGPVTPQGEVFQYHGAGPFVAVGSGEALARAADWWGGVCGENVVARGQGEMWSATGVGVRAGSGGGGH